MIIFYNFIYILALPLIFIRDLFTKRVNGINFLATKSGNIGQSDYEHIWVHGVSLGEVRALTPMVKRLLSQGKRIIFSSSTNTGLSELITKFSKSDVKILPFPYDLSFLHKKIINNYKVTKIILFESEFWPNLILSASKNIKLISLNTSISASTYKIMKLWMPLSKKLIGRIDLFLAQTDEVKHKLLGLGANNVEVIGNIKLNAENYQIDQIKLSNLTNSLSQIKTKVVAGSTHAGEEEFILEAFKQVTDMQLIIAPRHPERFSRVKKLLEKEGANFALYSEGVDLDTADIILFDRLGDLFELYALADIAIVAGSITYTKGHNFIEPIHAGTLCITGTKLSNFQKLNELLCINGPIETFSTVEELRNLFVKLNNIDLRNEILTRQKAALAKHSGNYSNIISRLING